MRENWKRTTAGIGPALLTVLGLGFAGNAAAECACMCVEGVSYEVCTGVVTTQAVTQACTDTLQCPVDTTDSQAGSEVDPPEDADSAAVDCRMRNVYRPDRGGYFPHPVCMPVEAARAHERSRERRDTLEARFESRQGRPHRLQ